MQGGSGFVVQGCKRLSSRAGNVSDRSLTGGFYRGDSQRAEKGKKEEH
jgi:hypothetical protein